MRSGVWHLKKGVYTNHHIIIYQITCSFQVLNIFFRGGVICENVFCQCTVEVNPPFSRHAVQNVIILKLNQSHPWTFLYQDVTVQFLGSSQLCCWRSNPSAISRCNYRLFFKDRRGLFNKRPDFSNSAPTSTESALLLLTAPSVRFWQQTAICPVSLLALVVELHPLNWTRAQAVRRIPESPLWFGKDVLSKLFYVWETGNSLPSISPYSISTRIVYPKYLNHLTPEFCGRSAI